VIAVGRGPPDLTRRRVLQAGAAATAVITTGTGLAAAAGASEYGGWFGGSTGGETSNYDGTTVDKTGQGSVTISVGTDGNGGSYAFDPPAVKVSSGTEVTFDWVSNTHNVEVQDQPAGENWQGESSIKNEGYTYSHTFETAGTYKYYCDPHLSLGMKGAIVVTENTTGTASGNASATTGSGGANAGGGDTGGGGSRGGTTAVSPPVVLVGLAGVLISAILALLTWDAWKMGELQQALGFGEYPETKEAATPDSENPIPHDEYDPWGTATLIAVYLAILVIAWTLMYYVEFLGHGPHILG